jgi:hypothetical protein
MNSTTVMAIGLVIATFFIGLSLFVMAAFRNAPPDPQEIELNRQDLERIAESRRLQSRGW